MKLNFFDFYSLSQNILRKNILFVQNMLLESFLQILAYLTIVLWDHQILKTNNFCISFLTLFNFDRFIHILLTLK